FLFSALSRGPSRSPKRAAPDKKPFDALSKRPPNAARLAPDFRITQSSKSIVKKAGIKTAGSTANVSDVGFLCRLRVAWGTRQGSEGMNARGDEQPVFTAKPVLFYHRHCLKSAQPPDVPLPKRLAHCRLPVCALPHATLQSRHSSLRSAPGKWRFGFLSLLSRHIYCSWFYRPQARI